ncbi:MAG: hypothetical protein M3Q27_18750, partial [Actinomycetota bacterium]|nr:hypothetical protein [Actinomycetota bacterium]
MELDEVADELYALDLADFTSTRTQREKAARAAGDRDLAQQIHALRKPSTAAWLLNRLARSHADEVRALLDVGRALREAQATLEGEALRELSRQRRQLVYALGQQVRAVGGQAGLKVSDDVAREVEQTLDAALADADVAAALAAGRLTAALQYAGFGPVPEAAPLAASRT